MYTSFLRRIGLLLTVISATLFISLIPSNANAAYNGGNIIDDAIFLNASTMSAADIQNFLSNMGSGLATRTFLFDCAATDASNTYYINAGAPCGQIVPASQIIYYASQIYGINPRVILATLQKEQSLITTTNPTTWQIDQAMGYGCPTTTGCVASDFLYQIDNGTWVLRLNMERARGNMTWWFTATSWVCGSEKNFYKPNLYPGQNVSFYDEDNVFYRTHYIENASTSAFYCYTPHAYNNPSGLYGLPQFGTTGRYYSGSYNFVSYFERWFGSTTFPAVFKADNNSSVYAMVSGYKVSLPSMAILQDYAYDPNSIATISAATSATISAPPVESGISSAFGNIIKTTSESDFDGPTVYFVSVGKKYPISTMTVFNTFGLDPDSIAYLPADYVKNIPTGATLSTFIRTPEGTIFKVDSGKKQIIMSSQTYSTINPSGVYTQLSVGGAALVTSDNPFIDGKAVFIKKDNNATIYLYNNGNYRGLSSINIYNCWGVGTLSDRPLRIIPSAYLPTSISTTENIGCTYLDSSGRLNMLNKSNRIIAPTAYNIVSSSSTPAADILTLFTNTPLRTSELKRAVKYPSSATVWYIENGKRRAVPSIENFNLLSLVGELDIVEQASLETIPTDQNVKLGTGKVVKASDNPTVYVVYANTKYSFMNSDDFSSHGYSWSKIETYDPVFLASAYPTAGTINPYIYSSGRNNVFAFDKNGCYNIGALTQAYNLTTIQGSQVYNDSINPYASYGSCKNATEYIKSDISSTVYKLENGTKRAITAWQTLININGGSVPIITILSANNISSYPLGQPY